MSTVFLHVGQCGNQVGQAFWKKAVKDETIAKSHSFLHQDCIQRSVHVDTEPKVVKKISKELKIREGNIICGKRGRGSNWALGYNGMKKSGEDHIVDDTLEKVRKEIERCDAYNGCIIMHSLSGGTGSGLGSRLCESVRDEYPMNYLISCSFAPCIGGESPLQHYNSLLTLSHIQRYADCNIVTQNDEVLWRLQKKMESVSFTNINNVIAGMLCGTFLPTDTLTPRSGLSIGMEPWEMIRSVCPMPGTKFVQINHLARSKLTWDGLMGQLLLGLKRHDSQGITFKSISNLIVARGSDVGDFEFSLKNMEKKVKNAYNCVSWNPYSLDVWTAKSNNTGPKGSSAVTVVSNHGSIVEHLEMVSHRSKVMYEAGAYLHWYWRYGASKEDFENAFDTLADVVENYKTAFT